MQRQEADAVMAGCCHSKLIFFDEISTLFGEPLVLQWGITNQEDDLCLQDMMEAGH